MSATLSYAFVAAAPRLCPGCTRRSALNALLCSGGTVVAYQLTGTSSGKRTNDPLALSTIACKQTKSQNRRPCKNGKDTRHLKLKKLSLRHKADREATGPKAPSATYAVKIRGVITGEV